MSRLTAGDPTLWLSRSWTTRPRRNGESDDAYVFVDRKRFMDRAASGGFLEWVSFLDHLYGTPVPDPPAGCDVVLEIDVRGAAQVRQQIPDAVIILVVAPSDQEQAVRLRARGDDEADVARRLRISSEEVASGRELADHVVVNDEVDRAVGELAGIIRGHRAGAPR